MVKIYDKNIAAERVGQAIELLGIADLNIVAESDETLRGYAVKKEEDKILIKYGKPCDFFGALLCVSQNKNVKEISKENNYEHLGYMADVARNAVPKISTLKTLADYLAIFGYDRLYIYLEDLFEVSDEPFFGYLRGRYTEADLRELDEYCLSYGIELVPCIQTLAHLNAIFKWPEYEKCCDVGDILLVDDARTEKLIKNMFQTISRIFHTGTVHVGMDEAHLVGRGKYLDLHGYKTGYEVMSEHVKKVMSLAEPFGFKVMIWSDMYFRMAFGGGYYSADGGLPKEISEQIPKNITLTYWDYFSRDGATLRHMMQEHIKTGNDVAFAGGAWKWTGWNPSTRLSLMTSEAALDVCRDAGVKNIMLTAWGDDGAEASLFTTLPIIAYFADRRYNPEGSEKRVDSVLKGVFGLSLNDFLTADIPLIGEKEFAQTYLLGKLPKILLYNDPLSGVFDGIIQKYDINGETEKYIEKLGRISRKAPKSFKYIFGNLQNLCKVLRYKATLGVDIRSAYKANDKKTLSEIANERIPSAIKAVTTFEKGFFRQWMYENKTNGYQTHDTRLGGMVKRLQTVSLLLNEYIDGKICKIEELEGDLLPIEGDDALGMLLWKGWTYITSAYVV